MLPEIVVDILNELTSSSSTVLEYGSGGSTINIARRAFKVYSVESDFIFQQSVQEVLEQSNLSNATLLHVDIGPVTTGGQPLELLRLLYRDKWKQYASIPWRNNIDFRANLVFIDGRFRVSCFFETLLRNGTDTYHILFDDYKSRGQYHIVETITTPVRYFGEAALFRIENINRNAVSALLANYHEDFS